MREFPEETLGKKLLFWTEENRESQVLVISDQEEVCQWMLKENIPILALERETTVTESAKQIFWKMPYVIQDICDTDVIYLERIYRRFKGIPWDILETERCRLREITVEDVPRIAEIYQSPSVKKYMEPLYEPLEREVAYVEDYIKNVYGFYEYGTWVIVEKSSGVIIGRAGLENYQANVNTEENEMKKEEIEEAEETQIELGYFIEDAYQRQGYAYEVCIAILYYAKKELNISTIWTRIRKDNRVSIALCEKLGFELVPSKKEENDMLLFSRKV